MSIADEIRKLEELRRSGVLTAEEFAEAKAAVLAKGSQAGAVAETDMARHLTEIQRQNTITQLDREWELERENYMLWRHHGNGYGHGARYIPSKGMSVLGGVVIVGFGIFWTVMAGSMTGGFAGGGPGGLFSFFPLFGVLFILAGVGMSIYSYAKASQYEEAHKRYKRRRAELLSREEED